LRCAGLSEGRIFISEEPQAHKTTRQHNHAVGCAASASDQHRRPNKAWVWGLNPEALLHRARAVSVVDIMRGCAVLRWTSFQ
jgi:hypothetical protein